MNLGKGRILLPAAPVERGWPKRVVSARWLTIPLSIAVGILVWQALVQWSGLPAFILPAPVAVWARFVASLQDGTLVHHTLVTLSEVISGLLAGTFFALLIGYALSRVGWLERFLSPYLVASQAIPMVAIAPLLVIWLGPGMGAKVLICTLTVFFPMLINTLVGLRSVPDGLRDLMRTMNSTPWQTLRDLEAPASLPVLFAGLRIGATLSVIGAVVGELVGTNQGLGFLINVGRSQYDTAMVFVAVFALILMALALYGSVLLVEHKLLAWQRRPQAEVWAQDKAEELSS